MQTRKTRHQFYLPDHLSVRLDALATDTTKTKTDILTQALAAWLERRDDEQAADSFGKALQRQANSLARAERKLDTLTEVIGLLVRHQLMLTAHLPAFDADTQRLGQLRYDQFVHKAGELAARRSRATPSSTPANQTTF